jgi:hypothetical protein
VLGKRREGGSNSKFTFSTPHTLNERGFTVLLQCSKMREWGEQFLSRKWLTLNDEIAYKIITNYSNAAEV